VVDRHKIKASPYSVAPFRSNSRLSFMNRFRVIVVLFAMAIPGSAVAMPAGVSGLPVDGIPSLTIPDLAINSDLQGYSQGSTQISLVETNTYIDIFEQGKDLPKHNLFDNIKSD
jgi:hypothetical protein